MNWYIYCPALGLSGALLCWLEDAGSYPGKGDNELLSREYVQSWLESELRFYGLSEGVAVFCRDPDLPILWTSLPENPDRVIEVSGVRQKSAVPRGI